jgi:hypothetical protein
MVGIIGLRQVKFYGTNFQFGMLLKSLGDQLKSFCIGKYFSILFKGILWGDDKPDYIQIGVFHKIRSQLQMPFVNGIKRTKKQPYFLHAAKVGNWLRMQELFYQTYDFTFRL